MPSKKIKGFTLVELVAVIVILGILAAVSMPRFVNLSSDASNAATAEIGASLVSAARMNFFQFEASGTAPNTALTNIGSMCSPSMASGMVPTVNWTSTAGATTDSNTYSITMAGWAPGQYCNGVGTTVSCVLQGSGGAPVTVQLMCTG